MAEEVVVGGAYWYAELDGGEGTRTLLLLLDLSRLPDFEREREARSSTPRKLMARSWKEVWRRASCRPDGSESRSCSCRKAYLDT